jgi:hypothetical protein
MAAPSLLAGAVQLTLAEPLPLMAGTLVGALGTVAGVTDEDGLDSTYFRPRWWHGPTVKVNAVPLVGPLTVHGLDERDTVAPPGETVTV